MQHNGLILVSTSVKQRCPLNAGLFYSRALYLSKFGNPSIVHADSVSKSLRQKFFFFSRERPLLARGKILYIRDSAHQSQNEDNFATFSLGLEPLNEAEKEKNNGKGDSVSAPSLSEGEMQQILTERHSGKTKQMTNWSINKSRAFNRKFEIKPIPILL